MAKFKVRLEYETIVEADTMEDAENEFFQQAVLRDIRDDPGTWIAKNLEITPLTFDFSKVSRETASD